MPTMASSRSNGRRHVRPETVSLTTSMSGDVSTRFRQDSGETQRFGRISRTLTWDFEAHEEIEARLLEELELEKSVVVTGLHGRTGDREDGNDRIAALGRVLQQRPFPRVKTLCLADCVLAEETGAIAELAKAIGIGNLSNLDWLNLLDNSIIGDAGAKALAEALESGNLTSLRRLDLVDNGIGDVGLTALARALGSGRLNTLKKLRIGGDYELFFSQGAKALAQVFESGFLLRLTDLHLRGIGEEEGVIAILRALESSTIRRAFKKLELRHCHMGLESAKTLANALQSCSFGSLTRLDLKDNVLMKDDELIALSVSFKSKNLNSLWYLDFSGTSVGEKGLIELASLLEAGHLPALDQCYASGCLNTKMSALSLIRAYDRNISLVANIDIDWPRTSRADKRIYWPTIKFYEVNGAWCTFGRSKVLWPKHSWQKYAEYFKARNISQMSPGELQKRNMNTF